MELLRCHKEPRKRYNKQQSSHSTQNHIMHFFADYASMTISKLCVDKNLRIPALRIAAFGGGTRRRPVKSFCLKAVVALAASFNKQKAWMTRMQITGLHRVLILFHMNLFPPLPGNQLRNCICWLFADYAFIIFDYGLIICGYSDFVAQMIC